MQRPLKNRLRHGGKLLYDQDGVMAARSVE